MFDFAGSHESRNDAKRDQPHLFGCKDLFSSLVHQTTTKNISNSKTLQPWSP